MATRPAPPAGAIRFALEGQTAKGVDWANVFWGFGIGGLTPTSAQLVTLATAVYNNYATHLWALQGNNAKLQRCVVNYYAGGGLQYTDEYSHDTNGGAGAVSATDSLSACISWQISATWRGGKPRTYMAALPTTALADSNTLGATYIAALAAGGAAFLAAFNSYAVAPFTSNTLMCVSFFSNNAPRVTPIGFAIHGCSVHQRIDSMRRRLGREIL